MSNIESILTYSTETGSTGEFVPAPFEGEERPCDATSGCTGTIRKPFDDIYEDCDTCGWGERVECCHECAGIDLPEDEEDDAPVVVTDAESVTTVLPDPFEGEGDWLALLEFPSEK